MNDIDSFLRECVFYPCSALHGLPVKLLSDRFPRFFYVDYFIKPEEFDKAIREEGFRGYELATETEITPEAVFGMPWKDLKMKHRSTASRIHFEWCDPFVVLCRFKRAAGYDDSHGPAEFELMFSSCEALAAFKSAFFERNIAPKCLVHIRSGVGFGGNFSAYPKELAKALRANNGGLPPFLLYDAMGSNPEFGDYLDLVENYEHVERWGYPDGGHLTLAKCTT